MGGMSTAAFLSKLGRRVLVLEQHYVPGGFTHSFRRPGFEWDVGLHAVGEVTEWSIIGKLLTRVTDGRIKWAALGESFEEFYWPDGFRLDFSDNPREFRRRLVEAFPSEVAAIDAYFDRCSEVSDSMRSYYLTRVLPGLAARLLSPLIARQANQFLGQVTEDVLAELTDDPKLRALLSAQWGYYGTLPRESSFAMQALVTSHFRFGAYYPVGGSKQIAREMLRVVADAGGWTRIGASVDRILLEWGRAVGVRLEGGEEIRAKRVVSAVGFAPTLRRLLPESVRSRAWAKEVLSLSASPAHVCLHIGFEGDIRSAGCSAANKWFYNTWNLDQDPWWCVAPGETIPDADVLYCSFPSLKDPSHDPGPQMRHTGEVVTFVPWESFERWRSHSWKKRGEEYEAFKSALQERLLEQFLGHLPQLRPMVKYVELSTPVSTDTFCRPSNGAIYGLEHTPRRFASPWLRPRSPVGNLYFSGSEVATCGVMGAFVGGMLAGAAAEPTRAYRFLMDTFRRRRGPGRSRARAARQRSA